METKRIQALLETIEQASLNKAAKKLGYTNSSLSYMIHELENDLGFPVLNRDYKGVTLTAQGRKIEPFLRKMLNDESLLYDAAEAINRRGAIKLRVGSYPSFASSLLPGIVGDFLSDYPDAQIELQVNINNLTELLKAGAIDLFIGQDKCMVDEAEWLPLFSDEIRAVVPKSFGIEADVITAEQLSRYSLIVPAINTHNPITETLKIIKPVRTVTIASCDATAIIRLAEAGVGIGFVSELYGRELPENLKMLPMEPRQVRNIGIISEKNRGDLGLRERRYPLSSEERRVGIGGS